MEIIITSFEDLRQALFDNERVKTIDGFLDNKLTDITKTVLFDRAVAVGGRILPAGDGKKVGYLFSCTGVFDEDALDPMCAGMDIDPYAVRQYAVFDDEYIKTVDAFPVMAETEVTETSIVPKVPGCTFTFSGPGIEGPCVLAFDEDGDGMPMLYYKTAAGTRFCLITDGHLETDVFIS